MHTARLDENERRAYWRKFMEQTCDHMRPVLDYPVEECGEKFASLSDAVDTEQVQVLFSETKLVDDLDRVFWLRESLIDKLIAAARQMNQQDWVLKIEDGYRSVQMQTQLAFKEHVFDAILQRVIWECDGQVPSSELMTRRLSGLIAINAKTGTHISGSAVDISVYRMDQPSQEIDRGGPYLEMSELSPMQSPFITENARKNRNAITEILAAHGFVAYPFEFWHYNQGDAYDRHLSGATQPARYGPVHVDFNTGDVTPVENPTDSFHTAQTIAMQINRAMSRIENGR